MAERILLVDDEEAIRDSLGRYLVEFGFEVATAASGEEALDLLAAGEFDLGIIDIRLPGMDGDALIARAMSMRPAMGFLVYTGSEEYELPAGLVAAGMRPEQVFTKPVADLGLLLDAVRGLLARSRTAAKHGDPPRNDPTPHTDR